MRLYAVLLLILLVAGCDKSEKKVSKSTQDSAALCKPVIDPNNPKPMALMMRQMAANADTLRSLVIAHQPLDTNRFPMLRFYLVQPTDESVLVPQFFENARLFQTTYKQLFKSSPSDRVNAYNAMIGACIQCHESYCHGPLKRIRKLPITGS